MNDGDKEGDFFFSYGGYEGESFEGPFATREEAIAAAEQWIEEHHGGWTVDIIQIVGEVSG